MIFVVEHSATQKKTVFQSEHCKAEGAFVLDCKKTRSIQDSNLGSRKIELSIRIRCDNRYTNRPLADTLFPKIVLYI